MINCDSQSAIRAINSTVIKTTITTGNAKFALNSLGAVNEVTLRWIPTHSGFEGNELATQILTGHTALNYHLSKLRTVSSSDTPVLCVWQKKKQSPTSRDSASRWVV